MLGAACLDVGYCSSADRVLPSKDVKEVDITGITLGDIPVKRGRKAMGFRGTPASTKSFDLCAVTTGKKSHEVGDKGLEMQIKFQVADVKKPLLSVKRVVDKGNVVAFGPKGEDSFIQNPKLGYRLPLRVTEGGSYMLDMTFPDGSTSAITVDSGAEENVCPRSWGSQFGLQRSTPRNFRSASGENIKHHGSREVMFTSPF